MSWCKCGNCSSQARQQNLSRRRLPNYQTNNYLCFSCSAKTVSIALKHGEFAKFVLDVAEYGHSSAFSNSSRWRWAAICPAWTPKKISNQLNKLFDETGWEGSPLLTSPLCTTTANKSYLPGRQVEQQGADVNEWIAVFTRSIVDSHSHSGGDHGDTEMLRRNSKFKVKTHVDERIMQTMKTPRPFNSGHLA